ncbi:hypothetical protein CC79DRAFT_1393294 [Sarocladium strictum]
MDDADKTSDIAISGVPLVPGFDRSIRTLTWIKVCLYVAALSTIACWALGIWAHVTGIEHLAVSFEGHEYSREAILFVVSLLVTFTNDALGYVHTIALRWALYREGRLEYNTNFRLFTSARTSFANRWYMNLLSTCMLILSYGCSSLLLVRMFPYPRMDEFLHMEMGDFPTSPSIGVNAMALMLLGLSLGVQALTALLCLRHHDTQIPTWSASPLANTLTALYGHSGLQHRPGRCMMSVTDLNSSPEARKPASKQPSLWKMRHAKWIVVFLWSLCVASFVWAAMMVKVINDDDPEGFDFDWSQVNVTQGENSTQVVTFYMNPDQNIYGSDITFSQSVQWICAIMFLCVVQGVQAIGLHCVELLVNMSRDEVLWQKARHERGASIRSEPLFAALTSWRTVVLTILKTVLHWLLGQSLVPFSFMVEDEPDQFVRGWFVFLISPSRLLLFAIVSAVTAAFTTLLAFWQIRSPQPAAWGNLQTLADLVDDWRTIDGNLWWGDKGNEDGTIRHAGTGYTPETVSKIDMEVYYAGTPRVGGKARKQP